MATKRAQANHDFELNLTPIIDCFVTLICFMLLSATYVSLIGLEAKVPIAVLASSPEAKKKDQSFKLTLSYKKNGLEVSVSGAGKMNGTKWIPNLSSTKKPDLAAIHNALVQIKKERPKEFMLTFLSDVEMPYSDLVALMDVTRNLDPSKDGEIKINDERNGKTLTMDVLFPDFVVGGLN